MPLTAAAARQWLHANIESPDDVLKVLDAMEDIAHESASEVTSAWQDRDAGRPWAMIAKKLGQCRVTIHRTLKRRFGYY